MKRALLKITMFSTLVLGVSISTTSWANDCLEDGASPLRAALASASVKKCLKDKAENSVLGKKLNGTIPGNELRVVASQSLRTIANQMLNVPDTAIFKDHASMLRSSLEVVTTCVDAAESNLSVWSCSRMDMFDGEGYKFLPDTKAPDPVRLRNAVTHCLDKKVSECADESKFMVSMAEALYLANMVSQKTSSEKAKQIAEQNQKRFDQWNSYLYDGKFPYWWEMTFNRLMRRGDNDDNRDASGNLIGPRKIPSGRWILLHPDAVVQAHRENFDDDAKLSFSLELIGYQWFKGWNEDKKKYDHPIGLGIGTAYFDESDGQHMSIGVNIHYRKFTVGFHDVDSEFAVMVNFDFLEFLRDEDEGRKARLVLGLEEDEKVRLDDF